MTTLGDEVLPTLLWKDCFRTTGRGFEGRRQEGSRVELDKKPALIAVKVTRGDDVLVLRDPDGFPRWAGWRRRPVPPT